MSEFNSFATNSRHKAQFEDEFCEFRIYLEGDSYAKLTGSFKNDVVTIASTRVPEVLRGKGYGKVMMEAFLLEAKHHNWKVTPVCSYVEHYLNRNAQWTHLKA
ncbi:GNAT family N-acetyltransferase [Vibrio sonorensis]|uniref:GNAT family N-acetyltransferase n=1 Tax=Vibrio sonorensis TaxID=1004316 RepID=UPI0008DAC2FF|nr:GNAT family N-acetyltransferase [Vibrio sonorensis]